MISARSTWRTLFPLALMVQACAPAGDQPAANTAPAITDFLDAEIREHRLQGAVAIVIDDRRIVYARAFGHRDNAASSPMQLDSLFRLYSMTKPITAAAVLILIDEERIGLDDPVGQYLPEFASPRVYQAAAAGERRVAAARNPLTVRELLRHTSGITYGQGGPENERDYRAAGLLPEIWSESNPVGRSNADVTRALAAVPLAFEPGEQWAYGRSTDVLGRLVEVVSGQTLDVFLRERLFAPLQMHDTSFNVAASNEARVVEPSTLAPANEPRTHMTDLSQPQTFFSGGGGLVGTALDYARFCQMLLNGGEHNGVRVLSQESVELMLSDQLGPLAAHPSFAFGEGYGFSFAGYVRTVSTQSGERQEVGWWGAGGTAFWCDRAEGMCGILLIQQSDEARSFSDRFHDIARTAFD
jgi:CubicO group peptidase (beta-lactamase class C family)